MRQYRQQLHALLSIANVASGIEATLQDVNETPR